jgi:hypothetical protein
MDLWQPPLHTGALPTPICRPIFRSHRPFLTSPPPVWKTLSPAPITLGLSVVCAFCLPARHGELPKNQGLLTSKSFIGQPGPRHLFRRDHPSLPAARVRAPKKGKKY